MIVQDLSPLGDGYRGIGWAGNGKLAFIHQGQPFPQFGTMNSDGTDRVIHLNEAYGLCASPDGELIAVTDDSQIILFSVNHGVVGRVQMQTIAGMMGKQDIAWSPDGEFLAVIGRSDVSNSLLQLRIFDKVGNSLFSADSPKDLNFLSWDERNALSYWSEGFKGTVMTKPDGQFIGVLPGVSNAQFRPIDEGSVYLRDWHEQLELMLALGKNLPVELNTYNPFNIRRLPPKTIRWSPNANKFLIDSVWRYGDSAEKSGWHVINPYTLEPQLVWEKHLWDDSEDFRYPVWSPDSNNIMFIKRLGELTLVTL